VRSEGIKRTLPLTTFFRFGKGSSRKPSLHRAPTEAKSLRNGWWLHSLLLQLHDLLIAGVSACSSSQPNFLHIRWFWRAPFFDGNDGFVLLILAWLVWFRSEERRVGKECRCRVSGADSEEKSR